MKTILIPTNFTDVSRNATDYAIQLHQGELKKIVFINTFEQPRMGRSIQKSLTGILQQNSQKGLEQDRLRVLEKFPNSDFEIETISSEGDLSAAIRSAMKTRLIDMIVMGSKGDREIVDLFIESETAKVIKQIDYPILVVPPVASMKEIGNIVFTTDLKRITEKKVLDPMIELTQKFSAEINVLHVERGKASDTKPTEAMLDNYFGQVKHDFTSVKNSDIPSAIYKFILAKDADIVTIVKRKGAGNLVARLFHQSISSRIVKNVRQTMLVLNDVNY